MILLYSIPGVASIKTMCTFIHVVVLSFFLRLIERRTLECIGQLGCEMVGQGRKHAGVQGRTGEVHVPASRNMYFTGPYSHLRCSTEILPCGATTYRRSGSMQ